MVLVEDEGHVNMNVKSNTQDTHPKEELPKEEHQKIKSQSIFFNGLTAAGDSIMSKGELNLIEVNRDRSCPA